MTDKQKYLQEFIKEAIKEMIDDDELLLVRDTNGNTAIGYRRETPMGEELRVSYLSDLDTRDELEDWGIYTKHY